jgi:hypothetical protein
VVEFGQLAIPEVLSLPFHVTVTGLLYQPFAFAARSGLGASTGAVESYLIGFGRTSGAEVLPAWSVQVPLGATLAASGPLYEIEVHAAIPEVASLPIQSILTLLLYQPF